MVHTSYRSAFPDGYGNDIPNEDQLVLPFKGSTLQPVVDFPADFDKIVVWGLNGTLVNPPKAALDRVFQEGAVTAIASRFKKAAKDVVDADQIRELVHESYTRNSIPTTLLAERLNVAEGELYAEVLSSVDAAIAAGNIRDLYNPDQHHLNCFEASQLGFEAQPADAQTEGAVDGGAPKTTNKVVHMLLTTGSAGYGERTLQRAGLRLFFQRVAGTEMYAQGGSRIAHKRENTAAAVNAMLKDLPLGRLADVIFVDDDSRFLSKVKGMHDGAFTTVQLTAKDVSPHGVDHVMRSVPEVFQTLLNVKPARISRTERMAGMRPY